MNHHQIVSRDEWLAARKRHLTKEKEPTRRGHAWDLVDPALAKFPKMPPMPTTAEQPAG